jgi:LytR cell envelope-related transcriptional attenuator
VDHPLHPVSATIPPTFWPRAAVVASVIAAIELVLLVVTGSALLLHHHGHSAAGAARAARTPVTRTQQKPVVHRAHTIAAPRLARTKVSVVVLNGNGRQGAAATAASRIRRHGYRIRLVGNAGRTTYARSLVMYRPGYEGEGRRLARDLGIGTVTLLDGMRTRDLHGAQAVVVIGS